MSGPQPKSPSFRLSRQGFQPLDNQFDSNMSADIPLQTVVSHTPSNAPTVREDPEKSGFFHRGKRRIQPVDSKGQQYGGTGATHPDEEDSAALNRMGRIYLTVLNFSIITRYMIYVAPLALILAVPIILAATGIITEEIGADTTDGKSVNNGAEPRLFFIWIEIIWLSFWGCKIVAHFLPSVFEFLVGVVSPGVKKYVQLLGALEKPLSFVFWMIVNQVTFRVLIMRSVSPQPTWMSKLSAALLGMLVCTCIVLAERLLIQLISISYHRKQFDGKIKESKRNIYLLGVMYDASRSLFPAYCNEFAEEDYIIQDQMGFTLGSKKVTMHNRSGSKTPMRLMQNAARVGDKVTSAFGTVAQEITGKKILDPNSAHSIVLEALEANRSAEALARRIWLSFVVEGKNELYLEDMLEVMGPGRQKEAEECFGSLDRDGNGDISLEEMVLTVTEFGRERKSISSSMHDVDQAINALDALLFTFVFVICIFVIICFLSPSFTTTLATSATALLSLSFVFAATCQEVLGSCIFLFVKHPFDIGDRVDVAPDQLTVEHISLLYTVFKRVNNGKIVQTPNIVLNNLWIENITRSKAMREQVDISASFDTSFEDINALKQEMLAFVRDPANTRDFHSEVEVDVVGIAEMDKLELRVEIRHKSNWSNESLRAARRSKFMCALVVALRKVPIEPPGGDDASLGSSDKPAYSVAISPGEAKIARQKYLNNKDATRLYPTKKEDENDMGRSSGADYLGVGSESHAITSINNRKLGVDNVRDDTWKTRGAEDDGSSTIGRASMDARSEYDDLRGLLHKASSGGRRKQGPTLSPYNTRPSFDQPRSPTIQVPVIPRSNSQNLYAPPPGGQSASRNPGSPGSNNSEYGEEYQYQNMMPQQQQQQQASGAVRSTSSASINPYQAASSEMKQNRYQYKP
ncbi:hypothetical protein P280DRAFT_419782 [Massarina eburnea CBS 473.64]|uniref:EF-hand domain-containing protein n=1 Tax=Massarina eburnea CBS 473.64 TaxID=1395130 RepID=A0A6A6SD84_9PLEO|nr:hypothetical protein P280DRAFT_419782 [Massarina eburnea CBS 473.64]